MLRDDKRNLLFTSSPNLELGGTKCLQVCGSCHGVAIQAVDVIVKAPVKLSIHAEGSCKKLVHISCGEIPISEAHPINSNKITTQSFASWFLYLPH